MDVKLNNNFFDVPILFLIFNRPETTIHVFNEIKKVKPKKLYVASDGPRTGNYNDTEKCSQVKSIIENGIDWDCEVKTLYRETNLGCKIAVSSAIDWFFLNEEMGIILEDDCVPSQSFFYFCKELLDKYKDDTRVMMVSGFNFKSDNQIKDASYYFSKFSNIWGWASWRRAWKYYDVNMSNFKDFKNKKIIKNIFNSYFMQQYWLMKFEETCQGKINTWDYQWSYTLMSQNGLCIVPYKNLISNIGLDISATHTKKTNKKLFNLDRYEIDNIIHSEFVIPDIAKDNFTFKKTYANTFKVMAKMILNKLKIR